MKAQMQEACQVCREAITNPVCPSCLALEMETWTVQRPQVVPTIRKTTKNMCGEVGTCTICGGSVSICAHCYSLDIIEWLRNKVKRRRRTMN